MALHVSKPGVTIWFQVPEWTRKFEKPVHHCSPLELHAWETTTVFKKRSAHGNSCHLVTTLVTSSLSHNAVQQPL